MDLRVWALAFAVLDWPERQKADLWATLEQGEAPTLPPALAEDLAGVATSLHRRMQEAINRGAQLLLPPRCGRPASAPALPHGPLGAEHPPPTGDPTGSGGQ